MILLLPLEMFIVLGKKRGGINIFMKIALVIDKFLLLPLDMISLMATESGLRRLLCRRHLLLMLFPVRQFRCLVLLHLLLRLFRQRPLLMLQLPRQLLYLQRL